MKTLLMTIIGIWLLKAAFEVSIGLLQILVGLLIGTFGFCLWGLSFLIECLEDLWQTAFSTPETSNQQHPKNTP